ncbi:MAG: ATP-grasp fold amidoligase family protein [Prevotellaceae bacterium]|nr:ATP-grasp fold amidoligase family protein [Prevotellaceae bacterium]
MPYVVSDSLYIKLMYRFALGRWPDLDHPKRFTEKLQWLKLHDRNPLYTRLVDKLAVKEWVEKRIGSGRCFKVLGIWEWAEDIDFESLPNQFVLKCNHLGGGLVTICKDKSKLEFNKVRKDLRWQLKHNMYWAWREWPYKNVRPKVFAEEYHEDEFGELRDYKVFCFNGVPKFMLVVSNRFAAHNLNVFDMDGSPCPFTSLDGMPNPSVVVTKERMRELKCFAEQLSANIPHVRVDFYILCGKIYFGEMTFFDSSGLDNYGSDETDLWLGGLIDLPDGV